MPVLASIILDSGSFISPVPGVLYKSCRVGYFQCDVSCPDVRIYADGEEVRIDPHFKFGDGNRTVNVTHLNGRGEAIVGVKRSASIDRHLLARSALYPGETIALREDRFDCILQFHSGHFRCSMVKKRRFKEINQDGVVTTRDAIEHGPIAHDVVASYELNDGDELQFATADQVLWSSKSLKDLRARLDIEILADDGTALKYYRDSLQLRSTYWVPNQGQPPPNMDPPPPPGGGGTGGG
jgi:hypothetical protein